MNKGENKNYSGTLTVFHTRRLPEPGKPVGYAALVDAYQLKVPLPRTLWAIGEKHRTVSRAGWQLLTPRHEPDATLSGHLTFALKYEGIDLAVLKRLFEKVGPDPVQEIVRKTPTGGYARRIWYLFEWLMGQPLPLPDAKAGNYVSVIDTDLQYACDGRNVARQRVRDNIPGTRAFCPLVSKTDRLEALRGLDLAKKARATINDLPGDLVSRTAAFLLLKDSRSSFQIEGESPPHARVHRWGQAIAEAGRNLLDLEELLRLQLLVIGDTRFLAPGLRQQGGFVGEHDRVTGMPIPDHISARPEDLASLIEGMFTFDRDFAEGIDAVIAAAVLAFGFVYVHPLEDGNGRLHRYLIHHVLAKRGYNPPGLAFPVSSAILEAIDEYRQVLESYSKPLLNYIEWKPTRDRNVEVVNDTADYYRFFDATPHAEFLYQCVRRTVEEDLPNETRFLESHDAFRRRLKEIVDMPDNRADLLFRFLHQNEGRLSRRARTREFSALTDDEAEQIEAFYAEAFNS